MLRTLSRLGLAALGLSLATPACTAVARPPYTGPAMSERDISVLVQNRGWAAVNVYVVRQGMRFRLGDVRSGGEARLRVPPSLSGTMTELQVLIDPQDGSPTYTTDAIPVTRGQEVTLRLGNVPALSSFSVAYRPVGLRL